MSTLTTRRALVFVDEVQKSEAVFDALKYAYDNGRISFIVSGSNPAYLDTVAKKRLQRRADYLMLAPFSLPETLTSEGLIDLQHRDLAEVLLTDPRRLAQSLPTLSRTPAHTAALGDYFRWGGLPLVRQSRSEKRKLLELRRVVERGFEPMAFDSDNRPDVIRVELAHLHSREFTYQRLFRKTGLKRRDKINLSIDELINHGYLVAKRPLILDPHRRSYLVVYAYADPGIVTYLKSGMNPEAEAGSRVEGYVHARLSQYARQAPVKTRLHYFKPYIVSEGKLKFTSGEIDFVLQTGERLLPIEAKAAVEHVNIDTKTLRRFMSEQGVAVGLVLYGGVPYWNRREGILFWPYWLV